MRKIRSFQRKNNKSQKFPQQNTKKRAQNQFKTGSNHKTAQNAIWPTQHLQR